MDEHPPAVRRASIDKKADYPNTIGVTPQKTEAASTAGIQSLAEAINQVFVGKPQVVKLTLTTLIARGHLLIEDVPGIGKTLLGVALAHAIEASFRRIQFTNDLLPSDILGLSVFNQRDTQFEFKPGPIFSHVVLADEINRSTPKTQSALLEAMNDLQVTIDGKTHILPEPFLVIATQNPVEYHGTFPLPEAQLDRFLMRVQIGYPSPDEAKRILKEKDLAARLKALRPALKKDEVLALQQRADEVRVEESLLDYIVKVAEATRAQKNFKLGLSPRGALALARAARAYALVDGRDYCVPDDVKAVAVPVIAHRVVLDTSLYGVARIAEAEEAVAAVLKSLAAP
ncbi:MAG: AAA family ATPase [Elusimicrobia bacterium]|nr:AAA family ATPase [Elusimicrobiota bacterium]